MKTIYTEEGIRERIREIREMKDRLLDREVELSMLHSAAVQHGCPVDSVGNPYYPKKLRRKTLAQVLSKA